MHIAPLYEKRKNILRGKTIYRVRLSITGVYLLYLISKQK